MTKSKPFAQLWLGCTLGILLAACTPQSDLALSEQSQPRPSLPSPWPPYWGVDEEDRAYLRNLMQGVSFFAGLRETGRFAPPKNDGSAEDEAYIEELEFCEDLSHDFLAQENITYLHPFATVSAETGLLDLASQSPLLESLLPPGCRNLALNVGQEDVTGGLWSELFFGTEKLAIYLIDRNHDRIPDRLISYGEGAYRAKDAMQALGIAQSELSPPWVEDPQYSNWNIRLPPQSVPQEVIEGAAIIAEVDLATCRYLRDGFQAPASHWRSVKTGMSVDEMESLSQAISGSWFATMPPKTQYNFFINYRGVDLLASFSMWRAQKFNEYTTVSGVLEFFSLGNANSFEDPGRLHRPELCSAGWSSYLD